MFKKHYHERKRTNIVVVFFRLILSLIMFIVLLGGVYTAYKHFSGLDPLKLDPLAVLQNTLAARTPKQVTDALSSLSLDKLKFSTGTKTLGKETSQSSSESPIFRFLLVADSHNENGNLAKAIAQGKQLYPDLKFIIGLGDYTEVGTVLELENAKKQLDAASLRYFLIPGDHDLWDCRNRNELPTACFTQVFGPDYQSFVFDNYLFLLLDNSDDYTGFDATQLQRITKELEEAKTEPNKGIFVFLHEPLFHPSSDHVMGKIEPGLKSQAKELEFELKGAGVKKVFSGDIHFFSEYTEPVTGLPMVTIGALTAVNNPQVPRFAVVSVLSDGTTKVEDVEIK